MSVEVLLRSRTDRTISYISISIPISIRIHIHIISISISVSISIVSGYLYLYHYLYQAIYFKEFAHLITGAGKSEIPRGGWQARNSGRSLCCSLEEEFLLLLKTSAYVLKAFNRLDEAHSPHIIEDLCLVN